MQTFQYRKDTNECNCIISKKFYTKASLWNEKEVRKAKIER